MTMPDLDIQEHLREMSTRTLDALRFALAPMCGEDRQKNLDLRRQIEDELAYRREA